MNKVAFEEPVMMGVLSDRPIRTVDEAASILRTRLRMQFTMVGLNTLLVLERAAEGAEIEEARQAFCVWASQQH